SPYPTLFRSGPRGAAQPSLLARMREALVGGPEDDEPPLIVRRQRAEPADSGQRVTAALAGPNGAEPALATAIAEPSAASVPEGEGNGPIGVVPLTGEAQANGAALEQIVRSWELPGLQLLADAPPSSAAQLDLTAKGQRIRETLAHFGIGVKVARIQEGPVVTQYALDVEPGIKLSRIEGLADNLALALSARSIRIEAPIPGEPFSGIEITNSASDLVTVKEVLASRHVEDPGAQSKLAFP